MVNRNRHYGRSLRGRGMLVSLCILLAGCPSDKGRQPDQPPVLPTFSGVVTTGTTFSTADVMVGSNRTFPRTDRTQGDGRFLVAQAGLSAPYVIGAGVNDDFGTQALAVVNTLNGTVNVTPLTRLTVLELLRQDPTDYFFLLLTDAQVADAGRVVDVSQLTQANLASAQASVVRVLRQQLGITVPASIASGDFATTPFTPAAGDPMFDTLLAFQTELANNGFDQNGFERARLAELARCDVEQLSVTIAGELYQFCPTTRQTLADPDDDTVLVFTFTTVNGNSLVLRTRAGTLIFAELNIAGQPTFGCAEETCPAIVVSPQAADQSRTVTFNGAILFEENGSTAVLVGTLNGGIFGLPALDCSQFSGQEPAFFFFDDGSVFADCYSLSAIRPAAARSIHSSFGLQQQRGVEVRIDGDSVYSVVLSRVDQDTFLAIPEYQCRGAACTGATLSAVDPDTSTRTIRLDGTPLQNVAADGTGPASTLVTATFTLSVQPPYPPPDCSAIVASQTVVARVSNEASDWSICPIYDLNDEDRNGVSGFVIDEFSVPYFPGAVAGDYRYGFSTSPSTDGEPTTGFISLITSPTGVVHSLSYSRGEELFSCTDAACLSAVTLSPATTSTAHSVTIESVTLPEHELSTLLGDRSVQAQGGLLTIPDCFFNGEACP